VFIKLQTGRFENTRKTGEQLACGLLLTSVPCVLPTSLEGLFIWLVNSQKTLFKLKILDLSTDKSICSDLLWRRANARNVSFQSLYGGQFTLSTQLINPKFCVSLPHQRSTTVSLETISLAYILPHKMQCNSFSPWSLKLAKDLNTGEPDNQLAKLMWATHSLRHLKQGTSFLKI